MGEHKVNSSERARESGVGHEVLKKNRNFYIGVAGTVLEGLLSGSLRARHAVPLPAPAGSFEWHPCFCLLLN